MALVQTRRSVSFNRSVYELAKAHVATINEKLCPWIEQLVIDELRRNGVAIKKPEAMKKAELDRACIKGRRFHRWVDTDDDRVVVCCHCRARGQRYPNKNRTGHSGTVRVTEARKILEVPEPVILRTDSVGRCSICGYEGPGPKHDCRPPLDPLEHPCRDEKCRRQGLHAEHL